jgi:predicted transcriptional regulator
MAHAGWIDAKTAAGLAFKFAGEPLGQEEIADILAQAESEQPDPLPEPVPVTAPGSNGGGQ